MVTFPGRYRYHRNRLYFYAGTSLIGPERAVIKPYADTQAGIVMMNTNR